MIPLLMEILHLQDKYGRDIKREEIKGMYLYSVNDFMTVMVKPETSIEKVIAILEQF